MTARTRPRPKVDLSGMPEPNYPEMTDVLVGDLLDDLADGKDAEVVADLALIRQTAGVPYAVELGERVGAVYRARGL